MPYMTTKSPTGSSETIQRAIRPCAVSVRTSRRNSIRLRKFSETWSITSAAFVPAWRCSRATKATWSRSVFCIRSATTCSATSSGTPSCSSASARPSSDRDGSSAASTVTERAPTMLCPARRADETTSRLSGNCSANFARVRRTRRVTNAAGGEGPDQADEQAPGRTDEQRSDDSEQRATRRASGGRCGSSWPRSRRSRSRARGHS